MAGISDSASLQFWQGIAAVAGAAIGGFFLAVGRRAGSAASKAPEASTSGDALQRMILDATRENTSELRGLRADWQAKRDADEARVRDIRERSIDERIDELSRGQRIGRANTNDVKQLLGVVIERLPAPDARRPPDGDPLALPAPSGDEN